MGSAPRGGRDLCDRQRVWGRRREGEAATTGSDTEQTNQKPPKPKARGYASLLAASTSTEELAGAACADFRSAVASAIAESRAALAGSAGVSNDPYKAAAYSARWLSRKHADAYGRTMRRIARRHLSGGYAHARASR